jgi:hypothetical protein
MGKVNYTPESIITRLCKVEVLYAQKYDEESSAPNRRQWTNILHDDENNTTAFGR